MVDDRLEGRLYILPDRDTKEDYEQEQALANLEGRVPRSRRRNRIREISYGLRPRESSTPLWHTDEINYDAIERLADWTIEQGERVQQSVLQYLDSPGDGELESVLRLLNIKFPKPERNGRGREKSLIQLMLNTMPATIDDLYKLARREHKARRPEAAVRANLRNLLHRGEVIKDDQTYRKAED